jgi:hypothetical protein
MSVVMLRVAAFINSYAECKHKNTQHKQEVMYDESRILHRNALYNYAEC